MATKMAVYYNLYDQIYFGRLVQFHPSMRS